MDLGCNHTSKEYWLGLFKTDHMIQTALFASGSIRNRNGTDRLQQVTMFPQCVHICLLVMGNFGKFSLFSNDITKHFKQPTGFTIKWKVRIDRVWDQRKWGWRLCCVSDCIELKGQCGHNSVFVWSPNLHRRRKLGCESSSSKAKSPQFHLPVSCSLGLYVIIVLSNDLK